MRFYSKIVSSMVTGKILEVETFDHDGPIIWLKGPTQEQKDLLTKETAFYSVLTSQYQTAFANQQAILKSITDAWTPVLQAGPGQKGYTPQEETAIRTGISDTNAIQFANAQKSLNQELAARGGGNDPNLPISGAEMQVRATLEAQEAQTEAAAQNAATVQNYDIGRQNYLAATQALGGAAGMQPVNLAGTAVSGGSAASGTAAQIQQAEQAASPWGTIGGILGGGLSGLMGNPALFGGGK